MRFTSISWSSSCCHCPKEGQQRNMPFCLCIVSCRYLTGTFCHIQQSAKFIPHPNIPSTRTPYETTQNDDNNFSFVWNKEHRRFDDNKFRNRTKLSINVWHQRNFRLKLNCLLSVARDIAGLRANSTKSKATEGMQGAGKFFEFCP